ncbi:ScbR family autoregulator-binding transcription factor [Streptomyces sp. NPDC060194]|uniref:ScbR family autoregulator-binding transcription factor n=1 Tax=Streptomyces sp. NPDC060194 TaxID=3347069 RepID=UPI00366843FD
MVRQERAVRTRSALIESAAELFDRDGFEATSLSTISALAGVSNGALHFHFASKAALADAVGQEALRRLEWVVEQRAEDGLQVLIDATHALVRSLSFDVVLRAGFELGDVPGRVATGVSLRRRWQEWVEETLVRAEREGSLASGIAAQDVAATVVAVTVGLKTLGSQDAMWLSRGTLTRFWALLLPRLAEPSALRVLVTSGTSFGPPPTGPSTVPAPVHAP